MEKQAGFSEPGRWLPLETHAHVATYLFPGHIHLIAPLQVLYIVLIQYYKVHRVPCCRCCTWVGIAEGQQSPCHQLKQGQATSNGNMWKEYGHHWRGREEAGRVRSSQGRGKENKVKDRVSSETGNILPNRLPRVITPPVWPIAPDISSNCSQCHMAPNACLLPLHHHLSTFPLQLIKLQTPLCSSCKLMLTADTFILLEKFAAFESNLSWQGGTDTLLLNCQQLQQLWLQWLVQTSRV